jgi:hypothetical protein
MVKEVIDLLRSEDWENGGEIIQAAKGKYKTPSKFSDWMKYIKQRTNG